MYTLWPRHLFCNQKKNIYLKMGPDQTIMPQKKSFQQNLKQFSFFLLKYISNVFVVLFYGLKTRAAQFILKQANLNLCSTVNWNLLTWSAKIATAATAADLRCKIIPKVHQIEALRKITLTLIHRSTIFTNHGFILFIYFHSYILFNIFYASPLVCG